VFSKTRQAILLGGFYVYAFLIFRQDKMLHHAALNFYPCVGWEKATKWLRHQLLTVHPDAGQEELHSAIYL
jgi:hypothetical protein